MFYIRFNYNVINDFLNVQLRHFVSSNDIYSISIYRFDPSRLKYTYFPANVIRV